MQSELEAQTSIEVLDVSEDRTQIRLKVRSSGSSTCCRLISVLQPESISLSATALS